MNAQQYQLLYAVCVIIISLLQTKIEHQIVELQTAEKALQRQRKKKTSKLKEKNLAKVARGLEVPKEAFGADEDPNLFDLQSIKSKQVCLSAVYGI